MSEIESGNDAKTREPANSVRPRRSKLAVAAVVFAVPAWIAIAFAILDFAILGDGPVDRANACAMLGLAFAVLGLGCGICGRVSINNSKGRLKGGWLAAGGIVVSALATIIVIVGYSLPAGVDHAHGDPRIIGCKSHLKQIGTSTHIWLTKYGGGETYPPSLRALYDDNTLRELRVFLCINTGREPEEGRFLTDYECILDRAGFTITESMGTPKAPLSENAVPPVPLAWDKPGNHPDGFCVVYCDGHVEFIPDDEGGAARRKFLAEVDAWIEKNRPKGNDREE